MKRLFIGGAFVVGIFLFGTVAAAKQSLFTAKVKKKTCSGYMVLEVNKGIDCNGDTIKLMKKHGFYEIASK